MNRSWRARVGLAVWVRPGVTLGQAAVFFLGCFSEMRGDFWVSPSGLDRNPGTENRPFASPERARDALRLAKLREGSAALPATIWFLAGDYVRTNALELTSEDGGTPDSPVTWRAARGNSVRWVGGLVLPALPKTSSTLLTTSAAVMRWQLIRDQTVMARLPTTTHKQVLELDLRPTGIKDFGQMKSRGFSRPTEVAHAELFAGGRPMPLARWPNEGSFERIDGFPETALRGDDHGGKFGEVTSGFHFAGDRPKSWKDTSDLWVHGYWAWDWANSYERVSSLDLEKRWVQTAPPHGLYGFRKRQRYYFLNILEELDQPGEWFLDRRKGLLYFWPPEAVTDPTASREVGEVLLSMMSSPFVRTKDLENLRFDGFQLVAGRGTGIEINGGANVRIQNCMLRNLGNSGVVINGGSGHGVSHCEVLDTGDGGVSLTGGDRQTLKAGGHFVENSHFQRQGRWSKCYVPAVSMTGVGLRASHNHIHDHPHCAILFWGNDHLIEFNDIHHVALETGDVGAIYTGRDYSFRGNRIRHNYIHETGGVGMGSMGVYMDDCVSGTEVYGNIFYKVHWAMFIGGGRDHRIENNIFVDCDPAIRLDGRGLDPSPVWHGMVSDHMRKQLDAVPSNLYRRRYPAIRDIDRFYLDPAKPGVPPENNLVRRNVCAGKWLELGWNAENRHIRVEQNLVAGEPGFEGPATQDFRLRSNSPAWKLGFQEIPVERIGIQAPGSLERLEPKLP